MTTIPNVPPGETMTGTVVLNEVHDFLGRFVSYPSVHAHVAHTLWIAHTHLMEIWDSTPRIAFLSPEPSSGKTRALEVSTPLFIRPIEAINVTPAYLFRKVAAPEGLPTILHDEIDTVFGPKAKENEEIRGLLNAGHRRGAFAGRCVVKGNQVYTEEIPAFCAVALAGLGSLPDTILTRSVIIRMRRRAPGEWIEEWRPRKEEAKGHIIRDRLAAWAQQAAPGLKDVWPAMPAGISDRDADVWEALLAVADAAGGDWPKMARDAAVALVTESKASAPSLGIKLLEDLRTVFGQHDALSTETILSSLIGLDESPWGDLRGRPLNPRGLAQRLRDYSVSSKTLRIGNTTAKGYAKEDFYDAWQRYLPATKEEQEHPSPLPFGNVTSVTNGTNSAVPDEPTVADVTEVTDVWGGREAPYFCAVCGDTPLKEGEVCPRCTDVPLRPEDDYEVLATLEADRP